MPESGDAKIYRIELGRPAGQLRFRNAADGRRRLMDISGYQGQALPAALTDPLVEILGDSEGQLRSWRMTCAEGRFKFQAQSVENIEECPALYEPLHQSFRLSTSDRLAVRVLLWFLRLPGGAGLLRRWHAHRH
jgi:hypothetical protein